MSENKNIAEIEVTENKKLTVEHILEHIEKIMSDTSHISGAIESLKTIKSGMTEEALDALTNGIEVVVRERETTNRELIHFYEKLYDDIKDKTDDKIEVNPEMREQFLNFVIATTGAVTEPGVELPDFDKIWKTVFLGQ